MKVIDLLNKIANGEEVPKKIRFNLHEYKFNEKEKEYQRHFGELDYGFGEDVRLDIAIDNEVEIIEEDKKIKIPDKLNWYKNDMTYLDNTMDNDSVIDIILDMQDTINEIIDYLEVNKK